MKILNTSISWIISMAFMPACLLLVSPLHAQGPGSLDPAFSGDGIVLTDIVSGGADRVADVAIQSDGKIVVAGYSHAPYPVFTVVRYHSDGTLDGGFGTGGRVTTSLGTGSAYAESVAIQGNGRIVVAGRYYNGAGYDFALVRYTSTGALDTEFNTTGMVITPFAPESGSAYDVAIQPADQKILVAGSGGGPTAQFILARYNTDGTPDTSLNTTGMLLIPAGGLLYETRLVLNTATGGVTLGGYVYDGITWSIGLARVTSSGVLDTAFSSTGTTTIPLNNSLGFPGFGLALQSDGKLLVAARAESGPPPSSGMDVVVARVNTNGSLDAAFGNAGYAQADLNGNLNDSAYSVAVQTDGRIVVAAITDFNYGLQPKAAVVRFSAAGAPDAGFGTSGVTLTDVPMFGEPMGEYRLGLALQSDGKIVVATTGGDFSVAGGAPMFAALRYLAADVPEISVEEPAGSSLVDGGGIHFGNVGNGVTSAPKTVTIRNVGTLNLTGLAVTKGGANAGEFTVGALGATTLAPGGSTSFTITFTPASAGARSAALQIASNDSDENPFDINLTGTGVIPAPEIAVRDVSGRDLTDAGSGFLMGGSPVGMGVTETLTVINAGSGNLSGLGITISGPDAGQFVASALRSSTLPPGGSTTFNITFTPASTGSKSASIHLASNDADENPFDIVVRGGGTATQPPALHKVKPVDGVGAGSFAETYNAPASCVMAGGWLFFVASDGVAGATLWRSDGTEAGTAIVKPGAPGIAVPFFSMMPGFDQPRLTVMGDKVYFLAQVYTDGMPTDYALWKSDGTQAGTTVVKGGLFSDGSIEAPVVANGLLFFVTSDGVNGAELWKSDGTTAGTVMVKDILAGGPVPMNGSYPQQLTRVGALLFFTADDGTNGRELWKSNGTTGGTVLVKNIRPGGSSAISSTTYNRSPLTESAGLLFFTADDGTNGYELWKSDGTTAGTVMVKDIHTGGGSGAGPTPTEGNSLTDVNGTLFFAGGDNTTGREIWKSNGTAGGTVLVKDISPGSGESIPRNLANLGGTLYALAFDLNFDGELWKSDGTTAGTVRVKDINPMGSSYPSPVAFANGSAFFAADNGEHGNELWGTDGTAAGTWLVADLNTGPGSSGPALAAVVGKRLYFVAADGPFSRALHVLRVEPEIVVEQPGGFPLTDGAGTVGMDVVSNQSKVFTIRNTGTASLTGLGLSLHGAGAGNFTLGVPGATTLAPGAGTTFTVTAPTPQTAPVGYRTATLRIASNDADENPYDIALTLSLVVRMNWRATWFGDINQHGAGSDNNDPDHDGVVNVLEFATGSNPTAATQAPGTLVDTGAVLEFTYNRANVALGECVFAVQWNDTLLPAGWNSAGVTEAILSDDGVTQVVKATVPRGPGPGRFVRLSITATPDEVEGGGGDPL